MYFPLLENTAYPNLQKVKDEKQRWSRVMQLREKLIVYCQSLVVLGTIQRKI